MPCTECNGLRPGELATYIGQSACTCPDDRPTLRDQFAMTILHKLLDRYDQTGYNDRDAICEAWKLADFALAERNRGKE